MDTLNLLMEYYVKKTKRGYEENYTRRKKMKKLLSIALMCFVMFASISIPTTSFAEPSVQLPDANQSFDLYVTIMNTDTYNELAAAQDEAIKAKANTKREDVASLEDYYSFVLPLTEEEYSYFSSMSKKELDKALLTNSTLSLLIGERMKDVSLSGAKGKYADMSLKDISRLMSGDQYTPQATLITDSIDAGTLTTSVSVTEQGTSTVIRKRVKVSFEWTVMPFAYFTDVVALSTNAGLQGLTGVNNESGQEQHMLAGSSSYGSATNLSVSSDPFGASASVNPKYTDIKHKGWISTDFYQNKTGVTAGQTCTAWGQYAHTQVGFKASVSFGSGGFSWSVGPTSIVKFSTKVSQNFMTY